MCHIHYVLDRIEKLPLSETNFLPDQYNNSEVFIKWADPPVLNGALSLYHLKFNDVTKREHLPICISYHEFRESSGYQFTVIICSIFFNVWNAYMAEYRK